MTIATILRRILVNDYVSLRSRLARRFGSTDFASEILHDVYVRLDRPDFTADIANPNAYLYRMALNVATDRQRSDGRLLARDEVEAIRRRDDEVIDPERIASGRFELDVLVKAMAELPERRRAMLIASRLEEIPHKEIAARFGVSIDTVERELKLALAHFARRMGRVAVPRRGPPKPR